MPRIMPEERYFSMPSAEVGGDVRRNRALNCWPCVRSLTHSPDAVIHSPAAIACGMADNGYDITMSTRLGAQNAKAILGIMVRDALDEAGNNLLRRFLRRGLHGDLGGETRSMSAIRWRRQLSGNIGRTIWPRVSTPFQDNSSVLSAVLSSVAAIIMSSMATSRGKTDPHRPLRYRPQAPPVVS